MEAIYIYLETGGNGADDNIVSLALYQAATHWEWASLVHPEQKLSYRQQSYLALSMEQLQQAPPFYAIAKDFLNFIEGKTLIAHDAQFVYKVLRRAFKQLGFVFKHNFICTLKAARSRYPHLPSYQLEELCTHFKIRIEHKSRLLRYTHQIAALHEYIKIPPPPAAPELAVQPETFQTTQLTAHLPEAAGVYYLLNSRKKIIYVGKSLNIKTRVQTHLNNCDTAKALRMKAEIAAVRYEITGSELAALLLESHEIKRLKPLYNRAQRRTRFPYCVEHFINGESYHCLRVVHSSRAAQMVVATFQSVAAAKATLEQWTRTYQLCQKLNGLFDTKGACFYYQIKECAGACVGEEPAADYNVRVEQLLEKLQFREPHFLLFDVGRQVGEYAVIWVKNGAYQGIGYCSLPPQRRYIKRILEHIVHYPTNRDTQGIIRSFVERKKYLKMLVLDM